MKKREKTILAFILMCCIYFVNAQPTYTDSLKRQLASSIEDTNRAALLGKLSTEYIWTLADTGRMYAEEGLQLSKKLNYKYGEGLCCFNLCISLSQQGNFTSALDFGFKGLSIFESLGNTDYIIQSHVILMICYRDQGDYKQALIQGYKAKELGQISSFALTPVLSNISSVYEKINQLDSALAYGLKVHQLDSNWSGQLVTLGNIYSKRNNQEKALAYYEKALESGQAVGWTLMDILLGKSKAFELIGKLDSSLYSARKSFLIGSAIGNARGTLDASKQLAHLYEIENKPDSVVRYLKLTITLNDSVFSNQQTREAQSFAFNEKLHQQELAAQQLQYSNKFRMYALLGIVFAFLLVAIIQYRNNKHKQKANIQLQQQKEKVESTLSELKSTQSQLILSEKMASLGELTAGIAHEIQNPLNFVNNFSEVNKELVDELQQELREGKIDDALAISKDIRDNEEKINHHGKRADAIVKGMLQHSRSIIGVKGPTDINKLAEEYLHLAYHGLRAKDNSFSATIKTNFDDSIGKINIIPQDIGRVLLNLYNNAFYAVNERKKITTGDYEPTVALSTRHTSSPLGGQGVEIKVIDNGGGIPQNIVEKIFQPFFTTKPTGQGTGLGLSLSYDIIKAHGGEINLETKEHEGTTFIIQLLIKANGH